MGSKWRSGFGNVRLGGESTWKNRLGEVRCEKGVNRGVCAERLSEVGWGDGGVGWERLVEEEGVE